MAEKIYISVVNNSDADRTDIVYAGKDINAAEHELWSAYNIWLTEDTLESDYVKYASKDDFLKAAKGDNADISNISAYIQFNDYHVNFELHECEI